MQVLILMLLEFHNLHGFLFLKCFDDFEKKRNAITKNYKEAIPKGLRWRDWAAEENEQGNKNKVLTGSDLIEFVNDELFPKLTELIGSKELEQRYVISSIFKELKNSLMSGYVLRTNYQPSKQSKFCKY